MRPRGVVELLHLHNVHCTGGPDVVAEGVEDLGRVAPPAEAADGGHPGIVPPPHVLLVDQLEQPPLGQHGVLDVQAGHLVHLGPVQVEGPEDPVVGFAAGLELEGADGVVDVLERVARAVGPVVGGVDAPAGPGVGMGGVLDPVGDEIVHVGIARFEVHLEA